MDVGELQELLSSAGRELNASHDTISPAAVTRLEERYFALRKDVLESRTEQERFTLARRISALLRDIHAAR